MGTRSQLYFFINWAGIVVDVTKFMRNLRVYVSAQRPIMFTGYEGVDPVSRWTDYGDLKTGYL